MPTASRWWSPGWRGRPCWRSPSGASPYGRYLDHGYEPASAAAQAGALALFVAGWALMIAATMLTTTTTLLRAVAQLGDRPAASRRLQTLTAAGFVGAWVAVGYGFRAADGLVHAGSKRGRGLRSDRSWSAPPPCSSPAPSSSRRSSTAA